ncbi:hypothetical protein, partial [Roseobacter weihaiensis]|uniref:hypothetical protein n=1 Tax=Roseobacter weihaiensis TaxID=2763262 RepID=UPI001D0B50C0
LGGAGQAAKATMRWTGASERTAKNWISGSYGPTAEHLIELMRNSDAVFLAVLSLAGRSEAHVFASLDVVRTELETMLQAIGTLQEQGHPIRTGN